MSVTVLGVFSEALAARRALEDLRDNPAHFEDVSIISRETEDGEAVSSTEDVSAGEGATVGAIWGGLVGLGALLIPGVGPFIAGGALFAALTGAVTGAVVGGITAALVDFGGIPEAEAREYERHVQAGNTLIVVKARNEQDAHEARRVLAHHGAGGVFEDESGETSAPRLAMYDSGQRVDVGEEYSADIDQTQYVEPSTVQPLTPRAPGGAEPLNPPETATSGREAEAVDDQRGTSQEPPR